MLYLAMQKTDPELIVNDSKPIKVSKHNSRKKKKILTKEKDIDILKFLKSLMGFSNLSEDDLKKLIAGTRLSTLDSGEFITIEGDDISSYGFITVSGCISMLKTSSNGKELIVELLQEGDIFGLLLMLAIEKLPAQLSARAIRKSVVLWIPLNYFTKLLQSYPDSLKEFIGSLLVHLQSSYQLSRGLAHDRVEVRIATILASLSLKLCMTKSSEKVYELNFTRQQLADLTGTTPETAIRVTRAFQRKGMIDIKKPGVIRILDLNALKILAGI